MTPIIFAILQVCNAIFTKVNFLYTFDFKLNRHWMEILLFMKTLLTNSVYPTWTNLIIQVYCQFCHRISTTISDFVTEIDSCSPQKFTISKQADILKRESRAHQAVLCIQSIFSVTSFLVCTAHFCASITVLTALIVPQNDSSYITACAFGLYFLNSSGGLLACLWIAGGPSKNANKFKESFERKIRERKLYLEKTNRRCCVESLNGLSDYTLSGCDIIYFRRNSILALSGTLLTYTFLLIGWK
ncbi:hypothetical protein HNY73_002480 [Argiope bruennichi]|uniref:Uncharacterized protein n=1 Tax=Argiope bruennichi TaxID=94029 RepID=A0A8T0FW48_ARGBR|nr:hypothetical protein HNY73_002480 [Argiope bruennichi]